MPAHAAFGAGVRRFTIRFGIVALATVVALAIVELTLHAIRFKYHVLPRVQFGWPTPQEIQRVYRLEPDLCAAADVFPRLPAPLSTFMRSEGIHLSEPGDVALAEMLAGCIESAARPPRRAGGPRRGEMRGRPEPGVRRVGGPRLQ